MRADCISRQSFFLVVLQSGTNILLTHISQAITRDDSLISNIFLFSTTIHSHCFLSSQVSRQLWNRVSRFLPHLLIKSLSLNLQGFHYHGNRTKACPSVLMCNGTQQNELTSWLGTLTIMHSKTRHPALYSRSFTCSHVIMHEIYHPNTYSIALDTIVLFFLGVRSGTQTSRSAAEAL